MPFAFHAPAAIVESLADPGQPSTVRKLLNYIAEKEREHPSDEGADFNVALQVELRVVRTTGADAVPVQVRRGPDAIRVEWTEEGIRRAYPWDYTTVNRHLKDRYADFVQNQQYHERRREIKRKGCFSRVRYLDPGNPNSGRKTFYSPNIDAEFDKPYIRL